MLLSVPFLCLYSVSERVSFKLAWKKSMEKKKKHYVLSFKCRFCGGTAPDLFSVSIKSNGKRKNLERGKSPSTFYGL